MARTLINGTEEILSTSIPWSAMASGGIVPISSIINGSQILLSTGAVSMGAALNLGGYTAQNSGVPVNSTDLTTKGYVDAKTSGVGGIFFTATASVANIAALTGLPTVDGYTMTAGQVVLLTAQTTASQNGPWVVAAGAWSRPSWWATTTTIQPGSYFYIDNYGSAYHDTKWWMTTVGAMTVDTTAIAFSQDLSGVIYSAGTGLGLAGSTFSVTYGTAAGTSAAGNDSRITGALQTSALGTNVQTALGVAIGSAGAPVVNGGALGTPSSGNLSGCSGLSLASGISGFGTGVATALAASVGSAGGPVVNGGALGTPSSGALTNATGLPVSTGISGLGSGVATALAAATNVSGGAITAGAGGYLQAAQFPQLAGDVSTVGGSLTTTVNNTSGSGFIKYTNFVWNETPSGAMNGVNTTFTLVNSPANSGAAIKLVFNGRTLEPGAGNDFTISGNTITMLWAPFATDKLRAYYLK